jgi:protein SCO1
MVKGVRNTLLWIVAFIALLLGSLAANLTLRSPTDDQLREWGYYSFDAPRRLQHFSLLNQYGQPVDERSLTGEWSLLFFGFTFCPDVCPTTLSVLNEAVQAMPVQPRVILVSVDPERDTPEKLANYVSSFNRNFEGYTGSFDDTVGLATQLNIAFGKVPGPETGTYLVDHSASIVVINPQGEYAGFIKAPHQARKITSIVSSFY